MTATPSADPDAYVVTEERARMLAMHATYVQGGYSTPEVEKARAEKDMSDGGAPIDWAKMQGELNAALLRTVTTLPTTAADEVEPTAPTGKVKVDITPVLADVVAGEAIRDQIANLKRDLKVHEDAIKDMLGDALAGVDNTGKVVVRYPVRNRTDLVKTKVREKLSDADYADCEQVTSYRTLHYGA